ncbi:exodeoxyribonuclease VII large subunit [Paracoccus sp. (in: a-proteobacteria)]|uniref:exodeoxyribonuclease VII large subunit n=1 Tax=Paracoccus sp. TaxID=267 RepID=UPI0026E09C03|nr:exodeoxyribonuclease VII large subunit [Paracoccus sp. (in: a-proteobacteria)]MDO5646754.1 exodeoxyribonuclease VII large subunit [Paracoccus sp. (in: a-proteobacteria)]
MDLIDEPLPGNNAHEFTVSELSGAVKRSIEDQFGRVRVRAEIGRVSRPSSGHLYFDLKDDRAVLAAVTWKGQAARLTQRPEEGLEVIATGRLTTFPGQSKYQMIVDQIEPAGAGALMAMLEKRRHALAAEGLFDDARKRPLPYLPGVIGVVTSPSGAVIRDILHRLRDRFPSRVVIWPVAVQGDACAPQVAAAIRGFNDLPDHGPVPRPDLIIVARGGGSLEDLWGFNEEIVVRAAADSRIPLISAVGHETDTTLIDFASDRRAPTPTAAAEIAVPVRADLAARLADHGARMVRAKMLRIDRPRQRLRDLSRAMGRPAALTEGPRQRFDLWAARLEPALRGLVRDRRHRLQALQLGRPTALTDAAQQRLTLWGARLRPGLRGLVRQRQQELTSGAARLMAARMRPLERPSDRLAQLHSRLTGSLQRLLTTARDRNIAQRDRLNDLMQRIDVTMKRGLSSRADHLARLDRMRQTLGYTETLKRGFAVVHGANGLLTSARDAAATPQFQIEFADGRVDAAPLKSTPKPRRKPPESQQKTLL